MAKRSLTARFLSGNKGVKNILTLSGSIIHELKNYLAVVNICAELSESKLKDISNICTELSEENLKNIRQKVKEADYFIANLQLQMKSIIAGKPNTEGFRSYSITKNIKEALEQYSLRAGERELIIIKASAGFTYMGNPVLTNHILYNLIKNSLRAIKNADKGEITITLEPGEKFNRLIFKDTATGISKEVLPKLFGLFESQSTSQGGTGIGLAFCKLIMQSYGGDISCDSARGRYTEFILSFPSIK